MARRSSEFRARMDGLRRELDEVLDRYNEAQLNEFAKTAYNWATIYGRVRVEATDEAPEERGWTPDAKASEGVHAGAFKSLTSLLGGTGVTTHAEVAFRQAMRLWKEEGKWVKKPPVSAREVSVWECGEIIDALELRGDLRDKFNVALKLQTLLNGMEVEA